jgi:hypothetical protein
MIPPHRSSGGHPVATGRSAGNSYKISTARHNQWRMPDASTQYNHVSDSLY